MTRQIKSKIDRRVTTIGDDDVNNNIRYEYMCDYCNYLLVRLSSGNNTESYFCRNCQIDYPDKTEIRKKTRLGTQREENEPAVASIQNTPNVSIRHEPELKGAFKALSQKGTIRFTSYNTTERQNNDEYT